MGKSSQQLTQFHLPTGEDISCVLWNGLFHISGTDVGEFTVTMNIGAAPTASARISLSLRGLWPDNHIHEEMGGRRVLGSPQFEAQRGRNTGGTKVSDDQFTTAENPDRPCSHIFFSMAVFELKRS